MCNDNWGLEGIDAILVQVLRLNCFLSDALDLAIVESENVVCHLYYQQTMCRKYGFYLIMSEGIIDLHNILFYLYKCHEQTLSW